MRHGCTPQEKLDHYAVADGVSGCLHWSGATRNGYGRTGARGRMENAHRVAYELAFGAIGKGLEVDHLCRNRGCVNPLHLEPVTAAENRRRAARAKYGKLRGPYVRRPKATHCRNGHEYTAENTRHPSAKPHIRVCRACQANGQRRRRINQ